MPIVQPNSVVKGNAVNINDLFKNTNHIPVYQRDYVWNSSQVNALWNDLISHYKIYADKSEELINYEGYFLGAMVVIENEDEENQDEVVDGQQRLTSLTTIATVCYDKLRAIKPESSSIKSWCSQLETILAKAESGDYFPKLSFSDPDIQEFFFTSTFRFPEKKDKEIFWSEKWAKDKLSRKKSPFFKMREAIQTGYTQIEKFLAEVKDPDLKIKRLIGFTKLLTEGVIILRIKAMSYSNAYAIFESLNNRGIPLSQSDLIKNEVLKRCSPKDLDFVAENWQSARLTIEGIESTISMPDFVHYSYISRYGAVKAQKLYEKVKARVSSSSEARKYSEDLEEDSLALEALTDKFQASWSQPTMNLLKDLRYVLNIKHCYPFLIAAYRKTKDDSHLFGKYVETIISFSFRYLKIMEETLESFTNSVGNACLMIEEGKDLNEISSYFKNQAPDEVFIKKFEEASFQNTKLSYFIVYYIEKVQLGGTYPKDHGVEQNLEHIMPKTPTVIHWPHAVKEKERSGVIYKEYLWKIGNLIPLTADINKSLKNKSIQLKIKDPSGIDYSSPSLNLVSPKQVQNFLDSNGDWTYESIDKRQKYIAENLITKAWPL